MHDTLLELHLAITAAAGVASPPAATAAAAAAAALYQDGLVAGMRHLVDNSGTTNVRGTTAIKDSAEP